MNFKQNVKLYLNETKEKVEITDINGNVLTRGAGQSETNRAENVIGKLKKSIRGNTDKNAEEKEGIENNFRSIPTNPASIVNTWSEDVKLKHFTTHPKTIFSETSQVFETILSRLTRNSEKKEVTDLFNKAKDNKDENALKTLIIIAKKIVEADKKDTLILQKQFGGTKEEQEEANNLASKIAKQGEENFETMINGVIARSKINDKIDNPDARSVREILKDKELNADISLGDIIHKVNGKYVVKNEKIVEALLKELSKSRGHTISRKEFNADLEEYNKVADKNWVKQKKVMSADGEENTVELRAEDLAKDMEGKYIEKYKDIQSKRGRKIGKDLEVFKKALNKGNQSSIAAKLEAIGKRAEDKDENDIKRTKLRKALKGEL